MKIRINRTIILPVVLYGCEASSFTFRELHKLQGFDSTLLKSDEVTGEWRRLHNEELPYL
jgi:hypothetical protein